MVFDPRSLAALEAGGLLGRSDDVLAAGGTPLDLLKTMRREALSGGNLDELRALEEILRLRRGGKPRPPEREEEREPRNKLREMELRINPFERLSEQVFQGADLSDQMLGGGLV